MLRRVLGRCWFDGAVEQGGAPGRRRDEHHASATGPAQDVGGGCAHRDRGALDGDRACGGCRGRRIAGGHGTIVRLSHLEIAGLAGTSRASVNRVLRGEAKNRTGELHRGQTIVVGLAALARRSHRPGWPQHRPVTSDAIRR